MNKLALFGLLSAFLNENNEEKIGFAPVYIAQDESGKWIVYDEYKPESYKSQFNSDGEMCEVGTTEEYDAGWENSLHLVKNLLALSLADLLIFDYPVSL